MRNRLVLVLVAVMVIVLAVHDIPLANHLGRVDRDRLTTSLERDAFILAGRAVEALRAGGASEDPALWAIVDRYATAEDVRVVITDAQAVAVVGSDRDDLSEDFSNRQEIIDAIAFGAPQTGERFSQTLGEDLFYVSVPVLSGDTRVGAVRISALERTVSDRVDGRVRGLLFVALTSLLITIGVAWVFARSVTDPMHRLQAATDRFAGGELQTRADADDGPPEVTALASSFNSMASRLEQLVNRQRAFAGTASHQLRTPLTALRLRLEQLAEQVRDDVPTALVEAALVETDRLHRMIEGLLALSRAEDTAAAPVPVDLSALVTERIDYWSALAAERRVHLIGSVPPRLEALAALGSIEHIIDNLVDNALEVSVAEQTLMVSVVPDGDHVEIHVIDEGPGLSDDDRAHAFERFWRGSGAAFGGSGLGLAIVQQLAGASDGSAELRPAPTGGIDAVVRLRVP